MTEPYHADNNVTLHHGDCLAVLRNLPDNSIDSIVTDPPYGLSNTGPDKVADTIVRWAGGDREHVPEGRGFMGRPWDAFVPPPAVWDECLRVLKPGGHMLVFAGSRTQDLMGLSIRLAGFELRDSLAWIYGSGMPKSHNISKAIDKAAGAEREVVGLYDRRSVYDMGDRSSDGDTGDSQCAGRSSTVSVTAPATPEAEQWAGWGTALKPSHEPLVVAQKPHGISGILSGIGSELSRLEDECRPSVNGVARSSAPTPVDSPVETTDTAPASAATPHEAGPGPATGTGAAVGSSAQMDTSWSDGAAPTAWSTVSSWRTCWVELCELTSTSITSTTTEVTTDLRTLWSSISSLTVTNMPDSLTQALTSGSTASAVDNLFAATVLSLRATHALSVTESATESTPTSRQAETGQEENRIEPILLARKPLDGTVAGNVLEWGTGALNIDASRVATDWDTDPTRRGWQGRNLASESTVSFVDHNKAESQPNPAGRWPANVLLDPEAAAAMDQQSGVLKTGGGVRNSGSRTVYGASLDDGPARTFEANSGGASRFFHVFKYQAKAPKRERPVIEREDGTKVQHCTVKPLALMEWLVTLITPPGGTVLDPFAGSGTTLQAARDKGFRAVGVEADADHCDLIVARLSKDDGGLFAA